MKIKVLNNYSKHLIAIIFFIAIFFYSFTYISAEIYDVFSIQGKLTNSDGTNINPSCMATNICDFRVSIYDAQTTGTLLWQETHSDSIVSSGIFSIKVGSVTSLDDIDLKNFNRDDLWLEIEFDPDGNGDFIEGEIFNRTRFNAVPYAMNAKYINGFSSDQFLTLSPNYPVTSTDPGPLLWLNKNNETGDLFIVQKNGVDRFLINNSGFVGLGTSSPLAMLNINSKLTDDFLLLSGTSTGIGLKIDYLASSTSSVAIKVENSSTGEITTAIDVSDEQIVNAINLGTNNIVSTDSGTVDWNDSSGNNLLRLSDIATNFGASLDAGAFMDRNSYFSEEFIRDQVDRTVSGAWGDSSNLWAHENTNCRFSIVDDLTNGISRQSTAAGGGQSCDMWIGYTTAAAGSDQAIFSALNLPVYIYKVRPSSASASLTFWTGLADNSNYNSSANPPNNGIYFTNNGGSVWEGITRNGSVSTTVTCSGQTISTTNFALIKAEVRSTSDVRFYIDADTTDGVSWYYCGQSITNIPSVNLTARSKIYSTSNNTYLDVDFMRVWQDDSPVMSKEILSANSEILDIGDNDIYNILENEYYTQLQEEDIIGTSTSSTSSSEYVTLIELKALNTRITTLEELMKKLLDQNNLVNQEDTSENIETTQSQLSNTLEVDNINVTLNANILGELETQGTIKINGILSLNSNNGGTAIIPSGQNKVHISYNYKGDIPKIIITPVLDNLYEETIIEILNGGFNYAVANKSNEGFDIYLSNPLNYEVSFDWQVFTVHY